jgi:tetratricopeptide (TPR) repeat protein
MKRIGVPRICLSMIVKDEGKIIERCLQSAIEFIDFFVIMDTGSKDDTVKKIKKTFDKYNKDQKKNQKIRGIIFKGEFKNFSHARNKCLKVAYDKSGADYILLLDADHLLVFPQKSEIELKIQLSKYENIGSFYITQIDEKLSYKNTRLIKIPNSSGRYYYKGYTHEVLMSIEKDNRITLPISDVYIQDLGDGGSKDGKSDRDQKLLLQEIESSGGTLYSRPYFYLANTYFGQKNLEQAEKYYRKRISLGGWEEELWYCYYRIGMIKIVEKNIPEAIYFLQSAIETNRNRLEAYFHLLLIFRDLRMDYNFQIYLNQSKKIYEQIINLKISTKDFLFYEKEICKEFKKLFISE